LQVIKEKNFSTMSNSRTATDLLQSLLWAVGKAHDVDEANETPDSLFHTAVIMHRKLFSQNIGALPDSMARILTVV
jgi:hypothetical protein